MIPALKDGDEPKQKTQDQITDELVSKYRAGIKAMLSVQQRVLDKLIEDNIEVVRQEVERDKAQPTAQNDPPAEPAQVAPGTTGAPIGQDAADDNKHDATELQDEQPVVEQPIIGFHASVVSSLYSSWKDAELEYANNMTNLFKSVRKQSDSITAGLDDMKANFRDFLSKPDNKQDKLDHFIESFNKFTEEFPELRPDEQTKEELNNRCDLLNEDFWDIIEANKEAAIEERARIIGSGWIEHELQQLTIRAQQFIGSEVKRCISSLNFIHGFFMAKKNQKPLDQYENMFPQKYSLSLFDESSDQGGQIDLPKVEDSEDANNFPLLNAIFAKGLGLVHLIDTGIDAYDQSDFEVIEAARTERSLFIFRT